MINFDQFTKNLIQENSLYKTPAERDDFIKDRTRMLDTFYINFFTFIGLFSINVLAPLKKYEQTEGKLLVDNIGDANHDVSLIIKLLYDQKVLSRSVVDNMTKLLVKIKTKQLASADIKEDAIRKLLTDMQYTSHRGSAPVMAVIGDFADGKIQLKHLAYQLYNLAKKKNYSAITSEIRAVGVYYSAWFKKVGADIAPTSGSTSTTQAATIAAPAASVTQPLTPASVVLNAQPDTTVTPTAAPAPAPVAVKTLDGEFWNRLFNARGKVQIRKLLAEYDAADKVDSLRALIAGVPLAVEYGDISLDNLQTSYAVQLTPLASSGFSGVYGAMFKAQILKAKTLLDIITPFVDISDATSEKRANTILTTYSGISDSTVKQHIIKLTQEFLATIDPVKFNATGTVKNLLGDFLAAALYRDTTATANLSLADQLKLYGLFGPRVVNTSMISEKLGEILGVKLEYYGRNAITKENWESKVSPELRKIIDGLDMQAKLNIIVVSSSDFNQKLSEVNGAITLERFISYVKGILNSEKQKNLDITRSKQIVDYMIDNQDKFTSAGSVFSKISDVISPALSYDNREWASYYWKKVSAVWYTRVQTKQISIDDFIEFLKNSNAYGGLQSGYVDILRGLESDIAKLIATDILSGKSARYTSDYISAGMSSNFLNILINEYGIASAFDKLGYNSLTAIPAVSQQISRASANVLFKALKDSNWDLTKMYYILFMLSNREEFGEWMAEFVNANTQQTNVIKWMIDKFPAYKPSKANIKAIYPTMDSLTQNLYTVTDNIATREYLISEFVNNLTTVRPEESAQVIYRAVSHSENLVRDLFAGDFTPEQIDAIAAALRSLMGEGNTTFGMSKGKHGVGLKGATVAFGALGSKLFASPAGEAAVETLAGILATPMSIGSAYRESVITDVSSLFANADITPDTERAFSKFEKKTQKIMATDFATAQFAQGAVDEINNNAIIKPRSVLPPKGALKVLKLNRVTIPSSSIVDFRKSRGNSLTLGDIRAAALDAAQKFKLEDQAITEVQQTPEELEKMSVVYNRYNRYKHGGIAVKIRRVFNVSIGAQQLGWSEFLKEVTNQSTYYYRSPQFHGTASLPASMILRYGFSVIDEKLARDAGIKYAGRMLGDGIYSSNVIDKVSQYINDDSPTGVSRRRGVVGYIFEMETQGNNWGRSCDTPGADFSTGGTGEFPNERGGLVSPEWAWKGANSQCRIKRCYEIELINRDEMDELVKKHSDVNEAIAAAGFKEFLLTEAIAKNGVDNWTSFTFMDNTVPIGNGKFINIDDESVANLQRVLPRNAVIDFGMHGVTIMFKTKENSHTRLLYGSDIMTNAPVRDLYARCIGNKV